MTIGSEYGQILARNFNNGTLIRQQFDELLRMRGVGGVDFIVNVLTSFCDDVEDLISKVESQHKKERLHIRAQWIDIIKESSQSVGSNKVTQACNKYQKAKKQRKAAKCERALLQLRQEFDHVKFEFLDIIELERKIIRIQQQPPDTPTESTGSSSP
ncbi:hypothetical protein C5167_027851 [Papaver somniferum]|nr:hypothetical protein C5167_027851 [Papaver somniferum]